MKRVYVAGPYNAPDVIGVLRNIRIGIEASVKLLAELDVAPFCPWLDFQFGLHDHRLNRDSYLDYSMAWLEVSDAVFLVDNWWKSPGTVVEVGKAKSLGIPIFEDMYALENWLKTEERVESINRKME